MEELKHKTVLEFVKFPESSNKAGSEPKSVACATQAYNRLGSALGAFPGDKYQMLKHLAFAESQRILANKLNQTAYNSEAKKLDTHSIILSAIAGHVNDAHNVDVGVEEGKLFLKWLSLANAGEEQVANFWRSAVGDLHMPEGTY